MAESLRDLMLKKKAALAASSAGYVKTAKLKDGRNLIRILPSWLEGPGKPFHKDYGVHYGKGGDGKIVTHLCQYKTYEKECPLCETIQEAMLMATSDADKKKLTDLRANARVLVNAINLEGDLETPIQLELPPSVFGLMIDIYIENGDEEDPEFNILTDAEKGIDLVINRTGTGLTTEYSVQPSLKKSKVVLNKTLLSKLANLDEFVEKLCEGNESKQILLPKSGGQKRLDSAFEKDAINEIDEDVPDLDRVTEPEMSDDDISSMLEELEI